MFSKEYVREIKNEYIRECGRRERERARVRKFSADCECERVRKRLRTNVNVREYTSVYVNESLCECVCV